MSLARWVGSHLTLHQPAQYVVVGFVAASLLGALLLLIPAASEGGATTSFLTALFTATSAVCVTGLVVVDTAGHWSVFGEVVILVLIQIGGFGIMSLTSVIVVVLSHRLGLRHRLLAAAETRSLDTGDVRRVLFGIAKLSLGVEAVVAVALFLRFWLAHGHAPMRAAYLGLFHAVSAFNNAGFALFPRSFVDYAKDPFVLLVIAGTVIVGGLGYPVLVQVARQPRSPHGWRLHTKLTLATTALLLVIGWAGFAWFEWTNVATFGPLSAGDSVVNALFHSAMPRTAGFNSIDVAQMREPSKLLTEILMVIGAGSASTAGGIKVTTFALLACVMWAEVRGQPDVVAFERRIPTSAQRQALTVALLAVGLIVGATMVLIAITSLPRLDVLFEVVSALGTVGLSTGATPLLSGAAQLLVAALMILGRVGPPTLFAALVLRERERPFRYPEERPIIG
ncbi:MAG: TrkH family potassium uptake protein [Actinomycetota bacterium]|nr:TrkH family potassium uptake protein [Actinomycetota bacterium]